MVVSDAMGNWLKCFATMAMMVTPGLWAYAATATCCAAAKCSRCPCLRAAGHVRDDLGQQFPGHLPRSGTAHLSSYALVALRRDNATATEAAMKYFVLGAMASGFLLYGCRCCMARPDPWRSRRCSRRSTPARSSTRCWCSARCSWWPAWRSSWGGAVPHVDPRTCTRARPRPSPS